MSWALLAALATGAPLRADERAAALAVIAEAARAHGGEEALARMQTFRRKSAGQITVAGKEVHFAEELTAQLPERWRRETEMLAGAQKLRVLVVVNGKKAWQSAGGAAVEVDAERLKELREDAYAQWLTTLLPLQKDTSLQLEPLPEARVDDRSAVGVKVSARGHTDVTLYFDKTTHLLARMARSAKEGGETVAREDTFSCYKEFDGVRLPTKVVQTAGGKKVRETTGASYTFPHKLEEETFGKP
jgi:hypothetical protein